MAAQTLQKNTIIFYQNDKYQMKREVEGGLWQIENLRTGRFYELSIQELKKLYLSRELTFESQSLGNVIRRGGDGETYLDERSFELAKNRLVFVKAILDLPSSQSAVQEQVQQLVSKNPKLPSPPSAITLIRLKRRYIDSGRDITSLIPKHRAKGNRNSRYCRVVMEIVDDVIDEKYMCLERHTVKDVIDEVTAIIKKRNLTKPKRDMLEAPKRNFIKSKIRDLPEFDKVAARYGYTVALHRFRTSKQVPIITAPLERVEIDHTQLDLFVIDHEVGAVLGRPWVTLCLDVFTRSILGIYVGLDTPRFLTVSHCLKHAFLPKPDKVETDFQIDNSWVQHGVMRELVVDNGLEFHSKSLENVCYSLGVEIHYSARKTPWFKGKVERFFRELNGGIAHKSPGTSFSNIFEKGDYDPKKHATIRYSILKPLIHKWIVDVYHQREHSALQTSPFEMWSNNISDDQIPLPDDLDFLGTTLGKSDTRTLSHQGIEYDRIFYTSDELMNLRRNRGENFKVDIRVDDSDLGEIKVICPDTGEIISAQAGCREYATGTSRSQHKIIRNYTLKRNRENISDSWILAKHEISELIKKEMLTGKKLKTRARAAKYQEHSRANIEPVDKTPSVDLVDVPVEEELVCGDDSKSNLSFKVVDRKNKQSREVKL